MTKITIRTAMIAVMMIFTISFANATDVTYTMKDYASVGFTTSDGFFTVATSVGTGTAPPVYNSYGDLRIYAGGNLTITPSSGKTITAISFEITDIGMERLSANNMANVGTLTTTSTSCTWEGSTSVPLRITVGQMSIGGLSAQLRFTQMTISYTSDGGTMQSQAITWTQDLATRTIGTPPFSLTATASSGLAVSYTSSNPSVASVSGTTLTVVSAGTAIITATQTGNATYGVATPVTKTITVKNSATPTTTTILDALTIGAALANNTETTDIYDISGTVVYSNINTLYGNGDIVIEDASGYMLYGWRTYDLDSLPFTQIDAVMVGDVITLRGKLKRYDGLYITGYPAYMENIEMSYGYVKENNHLQAQTITWNQALNNISINNDPITLTATASSGLAITYSSNNTNVATISGNKLTIVGAGQATITASQTGNGTYAAANEVKKTITVTLPPDPGAFKFTTFNAEWLSCINNGPSDEELQMNNLATLISSINPDVIALQEVGTSSSYATIDTLVKRLGSDSWGGSIVPTGSTPYSNCSQYQAIVYKKSRVQLVSASALTTSATTPNGDTYTWCWSNGRFPVKYEVNLLTEGGIENVIFVNVHAKAMSDETSYTKRVGGSYLLKGILDGAAYNTKNIVFIGDFNDYLNSTMCTACNPISPYDNFISDATNYQGLTSGIKQYNYNNPTIDNIIISNELFDNYVANSAKMEIAAANAIDNFDGTTSNNHRPVSASFSFAGSTTSIVNNVSNNLFVIYPSPVKDVLNISEWQTDTDVIIVDLLGKQHFNKKMVGTSIDVSNLSRGIYILKVGDKTAKFVKE